MSAGYYVDCSLCGAEKFVGPGNHHPWCHCGSDLFRWGEERDSSRDSPATPQPAPAAVSEPAKVLTEDQLQAIAEKLGQQSVAWTGIGARDVEEVLKQARAMAAEPVAPAKTKLAWNPDFLTPAEAYEQGRFDEQAEQGPVPYPDDVNILDGVAKYTALVNAGMPPSEAYRLAQQAVPKGQPTPSVAGEPAITVALLNEIRAIVQNTEQPLGNRLQMIDARVANFLNPPGAAHQWDDAGERCTVCGDKDWMGGPCSGPAEPAITVQATAETNLGERCAPTLAQHNGVKTHDRRTEDGSSGPCAEGSSSRQTARGDAACTSSAERGTGSRNAEAQRGKVATDAQAPHQCGAPATEPAITVPADSDPINCNSMLLDAVKALAEIDALLGLPEDGCNDPQITVSALADYIAAYQEAAKYRDQWVDAQYAAAAVQAEAEADDTAPCATCGRTPGWMDKEADRWAREPDQWIDDPHDIEQGQMLNPAWLKLHGKTAKEAAHPEPAITVQAEPADPYREHLATQAENIEQDRLDRTLTLMGVARAGEGQEAFSARLAENVNRLTLAIVMHFRPSEAAAVEPAAQSEDMKAGLLALGLTADECIAMLIAATQHRMGAALAAQPPAPQAEPAKLQPADYSRQYEGMDGIDYDAATMAAEPVVLATPQPAPAAVSDLLTEIRTIVHDSNQPLGNRLQMITSRVALFQAGTHTSPAPASVEAPTEPAITVQAEPVAWENFPCYLIDHCEGETITEEALQRWLAAMLKDPQYAAHPEPAPQSEGEREVLIELIQQHLTSMYACGRVWEAWTVGSMSEDDFTPAQETDFSADLADAILATQQPAPAAVEAPTEPSEFGPKITIKTDRSCRGCKALESESYAVQSDTGFYHYCAHPSLPAKKRIPGYGTDTPDWCAALAASPSQVSAQEAETRFLNLVLDIRRIIGWEKPINDFEVVAELQEYIDGFVRAPEASQGAPGEAQQQQEREAARYRWLRSNYVPPGDLHQDFDATDRAVAVGGRMLDEAIDAALQAAKEAT